MTLICHIYHYNNAIFGSLLVPAMESEKLSNRRQNGRYGYFDRTTPVSYPIDCVAERSDPVHSENTSLGLNSGPVNWDFILEPEILQ